MKKYFLIALCAVVVLAGCKSKSSFSFTFDDFSFSLFTNEKIYIPWTIGGTGTQDMHIITTMKEKTAENDTGYSNSLLVANVLVDSGLVVKDLVVENTKKLKIQLLKYSDITNTPKNITCGKKQYSGYVTAFSYYADTGTLYGSEYFFIKDTSLYVVSLSSDEKKDIQSFVDSTKNITCTK